MDRKIVLSQSRSFSTPASILTLAVLADRCNENNNSPSNDRLPFAPAFEGPSTSSAFEIVREQPRTNSEESVYVSLEKFCKPRTEKLPILPNGYVPLEKIYKPPSNEKLAYLPDGNVPTEDERPSKSYWETFTDWCFCNPQLEEMPMLASVLAAEKKF